MKNFINILNEEFNPEEPSAVWCSDITYIWTYEGFVHLTSIMDLYSRKINDGKYMNNLKINVNNNLGILTAVLGEEVELAKKVCFVE